MSDLAEAFAELPESIQQGIRDLGWHTPMPVQEKVLPAMLAGGDVIVQAQTGSGKPTDPGLLRPLRGLTLQTGPASLSP